MNRRGFLKLGAAALAGAAVAKRIPALALLAEIAENEVATGLNFYDLAPCIKSLYLVPVLHPYTYDPKTGVYTLDIADAGRTFVITYDYKVRCIAGDSGDTESHGSCLPECQQID